VRGDNRGKRRIRAAVVDEQDLPALFGADAIENGGETGHEVENRLFLVLDRGDDREERLARRG
jgi:hypothetical protein